MVDPSEKDLPPAQRLALDLLEAEGPCSESAQAAVAACRSVLERMYEKLQPVVGRGGYEMLLGRAAVVAARRHPRLGDLPIPSDGPPSMDQLTEGLTDHDGTPVCVVACRLLAEFLGFLARLVGWGLVVVLLRDPWPDVLARHRDSLLEDSSASSRSTSEG